MDLWIASAVFVAAYILIATESVHRVAAALGGAGVILGLGILTTEDAFFSRETGVDWDVIFLLLGMMILVAFFKQTGVFDYIAVRIAKRAQGRPFPILVMLILFTAVASALLDNVTTVLLIAPITLSICRQIGAPAIPFLIAEALASNIGGTATLVGDPPNIIIAARADLTFNDFLVHLAPLVAVLIVAFIALSRVLFRSALKAEPAELAELMRIDERALITDKKLLVQSSIALTLIVIGFVLQRVTHIDPAVVALIGSGLLLFIAPQNLGHALQEVEWETLAFFAGLFILVGALVHVGALEKVAQRLVPLTQQSQGLALVIILVASALISAIVDNIPYVTAMSPVVSELIAATPALAVSNAMWWSLALGADLGGNATAVGASANVVVVGIARKAGLHISFAQWLKYGVPTTILTVGLSIPYLLLRY